MVLAGLRDGCSWEFHGHPSVKSASTIFHGYSRKYSHVSQGLYTPRKYAKQIIGCMWCRVGSYPGNMNLGWVSTLSSSSLGKVDKEVYIHKMKWYRLYRLAGSHIIHFLSYYDGKWGGEARKTLNHIHIIIPKCVSFFWLVLDTLQKQMMGDTILMVVYGQFSYL